MQGVQERGPRAGDKIGTPRAWQCKAEEERWGRHLKEDVSKVKNLVLHIY